MPGFDSPSPLSVGIGWASRIMTMGLGFVLPVLAGNYADKRFGTSPAGLVVGMLVGFSVGVFSIVSIAKGSNQDGTPKSP